MGNMKLSLFEKQEEVRRNILSAVNGHLKHNIPKIPKVKKNIAAFPKVSLKRVEDDKNVEKYYRDYKIRKTLLEIKNEPIIDVPKSAKKRQKSPEPDIEEVKYSANDKWEPLDEEWASLLEEIPSPIKSKDEKKKRGRKKKSINFAW